MSEQTLPYELLLPIFKDVVDRADATNSFMQCVYLSQVCRWWRAVALSREEFWEVIPQKSSGLTNMCLTRCHTPLRMVIDTSLAQDNAYRASVRLALAHFSRVKSLQAGAFRLWSQSDDHLGQPIRIHTPATMAEESLLNELMRALCDRHARNLEELSLAFSGGHPAQRVIVPAVALRGMRTISLTGCRLPTPRYRFASSVRSLDLVDIRAWASIQDTIQFFRDVPQLEHFSYNRNTRHPGEVPSNQYWSATLPERRSVRLEHLRSFRIVGALLESYAVFSCLSFSQSTSLVIQSAIPDHPLNEAQYVTMIDRSQTALRDHFSPAIVPHDPFSAAHITENRFAIVNDHQRHLADVPPASVQLCLDVPNSMGLAERRSLVRLWRHSVISLPILARAATLIFDNSFLDCHHRDSAMLSGFAHAETIQLRDSTDIWELYVAVRRGHLFPGLRCVRLTDTTLDELVRSTLEKLVNALRTTYPDVDMRMEVRRCWVGRKLLEDLAARLHPGRVDWDEYKKDEMPYVLEPGVPK
ncbi:hypothetical protein PENSPDRAFT_652722 [Peniophora sp. CONT]|nr:hypothetical protein PENSPDRAFT_652722 [Peniophora sp. CONT]